MTKPSQVGKALQYVLLVWDDAVNLIGTFSEDDMEDLIEIMSVHTAGILVHEDDNIIVVAGDMYTDEDDKCTWRQVTIIPQSLIRRREDLYCG